MSKGRSPSPVPIGTAAEGKVLRRGGGSDAMTTKTLGRDTVADRSPSSLQRYALCFSNYFRICGVQSVSQTERRVRLNATD